jgi:hypothetical protein
MLPSAIVVALLLSVASAASAGGIHARIEGPGPDGRTYTVRTLACDRSTSLEPWAIAEGVVGGAPRSVLLRLEPTSEHGVFRFERAWPQEGRWMIRLSLGAPPAPATVATLRSNGTIKGNSLHFNTDGSSECRKALRHLLKNPGEGC